MSDVSAAIDVTQLFAPLSLEEFSTQVWEQCTYLFENFILPHEARISTPSFWSIAHGSASKVLWAQIGDEPQRLASCSESREVFERGGTVVINNVENYHDGVARFIDGLREGLLFCGGISASLFLSGNNGGFPRHMDEDNSFVFQLEGEKTWAVDRSPVIPGVTRNIFDTPSDRDQYCAVRPWARVLFDKVVERESRRLCPGRCLYVPSGTWHRPIAHGVSLAMTVALHSRRMEGLIADRLAALLSHKWSWRRGIPIASAHSTGRVPIDVERNLTEKLHDLQSVVASMTIADLVAHWRKGCATSRTPVPETPSLLPDTTLVVDPTAWVGHIDGHTVVVATSKRWFEIDADLRKFVCALVSAGRFTPAGARGLCSDATLSEVCEFLHALCGEGLLSVDQ